MASAETSIIKQLGDVTECPICCESFTDPRSLPCIHAYCLKCIESYGRNNQPGSTMPCLLCRKEFMVPEGGLGALPRNFFIEKLLSVKLVKLKQFCVHVLWRCAIDTKTRPWISSVMTARWRCVSSVLSHPTSNTTVPTSAT